MNLIYWQLFWKDKNKEKRGRDWPIKKKYENKYLQNCNSKSRYAVKSMQEETKGEKEANQLRCSESSFLRKPLRLKQLSSCAASNKSGSSSYDKTLNSDAFSWRTLSLKWNTSKHTFRTDGETSGFLLFSGTRWLKYFKIFGHLQQRKLAQKHSILPK